MELLQIKVAMFDESVTNYFKAMDTIAELCGEDVGVLLEGNVEIKTSFMFFKKWKQLHYRTLKVRFSDNISSSEMVSLPPFSSAAIPHVVNGNANSPMPYRDFIFNAGGSVWALDWCPKVHSEPMSPSKCEFVAVAVHPSESFYHKIGVPLHGHGIVQIWCMVNTSNNSEESLLNKNEKRKGKTAKKREETLVNVPSKRPRGRPRKKQLEDHTTGFCKTSSEKFENIYSNAEDTFQVNFEFNNDKYVSLSSKERHHHDSKLSRANNNVGVWETNERSSGRSLLSVTTWKGHIDSEFEETNALSNSVTRFNNKENYEIPLPRMAICLVHKGRVVWDLKWKGNNISNCYQMGYLAVLLGNGSLEVWEIPSPAALRKSYFCSSEGVDPRFIKPIPVFKCSLLSCGAVQSIPLAVEWSSSDDILVGCHDGTVALWKFSPAPNCDDTMPFLCFSADTLPIRAVAWNPLTNNEGDLNVILTAGHGGLKFWDIRDPFRPLCDLRYVPRFIYSVAWVPDPKCVMSAYDDGMIRLQSFTKSGFHTINCGSSAIWSVHVSRIADMVAYCCADGTVSYFKLNKKAVEKDPSRHKMATLVCGRVSCDEEGCVVVHTPHVSLKGNGNTMVVARPDMEMPEKKVAMQRVRWNPNRGSERWLCSAGASAIVLCQEILPS